MPANRREPVSVPFWFQSLKNSRAWPAPTAARSYKCLVSGAALESFRIHLGFVGAGYV